MPNFYTVIREALRRSGCPDDPGTGKPDKAIDYLAILHFKRSAHDAVLAELGLRPAQTTYLDEYGHLGQNDQVLSLELGLAAGKVRDGSTIVFVGAGLGFVWASTVVAWGPFAG
jgi:3-oxoacyl-[acyl-carrier-protein] synthase-3